MQKNARSLFQALAASLLCAAFVSACATTPSVPMPPNDLDGAKYKLVAISGRMDQRVVQFKKKGNGLIGTVISKGRTLTELVGIPDELVTFQLTPASGGESNVYEGTYIDFATDGTRSEREVRVTFYKDSFMWTLESATWERVQD